MRLIDTTTPRPLPLPQAGNASSAPGGSARHQTGGRVGHLEVLIGLMSPPPSSSLSSSTAPTSAIVPSHHFLKLVPALLDEDAQRSAFGEEGVQPAQAVAAEVLCALHCAGHPRCVASECCIVSECSRVFRECSRVCESACECERVFACSRALHVWMRV